MPVPEAIKRKGRLERFKYGKGNYFVAEFTDLDTSDKFVGTGTIPGLREDSVYNLEGFLVDNPRYGRQMQIEQAELQLPKKKDAVITFLAGKRFEGVGKKTAEKIVETLGDDAIETILNNPSVLTQQCGLNEKRAQAVQDGLDQIKGSELHIKLLSYGVREKQIQALENYYDKSSLLGSSHSLEAVLKRNCFEPVYEVKGFGYKSAEKIADGMKIAQNDPRRLQAFIYNRMQELTFQQGSTCVLEKELYDACGFPDPQGFHDAVQYLINCRTIVFDPPTRLLYPADLYRQEKVIAATLYRHMFPVEKPDSEELERVIEKRELQSHIQYDEVQKKAIRDFFSHSVMILNGGPGTGKSTTVQGILDVLHDLYPASTVKLAAPTGRAAKRLQEVTHREARTIHSLLGYNIDSETFNTEGKDLDDLDFLIVDEFSMVDTRLFAALLENIPDECRLLLIGDEDQLPSVSPGRVFNDIIETGLIPMVSLQTVHRQKEGSGIANLASEIRHEQKLVYEGGVHMNDLPDSEVIPYVDKLVDAAFDLDQTMILAPRYDGDLGINTINAAMQTKLNPFSPNKAEIYVGKTVFREDDKIILKKNTTITIDGDGDKKRYVRLCNGDLGKITQVDPKEEIVTCLFDGYTLDLKKEDLQENISHAWCISVHKAQGSEFQQVICVIDPRAYMLLEKRLLYTAISRAKKQLDIVGSQSVFEAKVRAGSVKRRRTTLKERLKEVFSNRSRITAV